MPFRKFTDLERQQLKQLVIEATIQRLSVDETLAYIHQRMGQTISSDYLRHIRAANKNTAGHRIAHLQKDRYAYLQIFFDRIDELRAYQSEQWRIYHENTERPLIQYACLKELHQLTISLGNYYDVLPSLTSSYVPSYTSKSSVSAEAKREAGTNSEIPV